MTDKVEYGEGTEDLIAEYNAALEDDTLEFVMNGEVYVSGGEPVAVESTPALLEVERMINDPNVIQRQAVPRDVPAGSSEEPTHVVKF